MNLNNQDLKGAALHRAIAEAIEKGRGPEAFMYLSSVGYWRAERSFGAIVSFSEAGHEVRWVPPSMENIPAAYSRLRSLK